MSRRSEHTTKVFVGSLPPNVTADDLRQLFAPYGAIAECDIANRCGFLHLEDKDLANKAIAELNNTTFMGGRISVEKGRVKPRGDNRRIRGRDRKRDAGPYSREATYSREPPRNGGGGGGGGGAAGAGYGRPEYGGGYDEYRAEYPRGAYDDGYDRRPVYDERRGGGYMADRRPYNGYERRPYDERAPYPDPTARAAYDERRMPPTIPTTYDDRRPPAERRPLIPDQSLSSNVPRPPSSYDRAPPSTDMYSRRDATAPKPLTDYSTGTAGYDRTAQSSFPGYNNTTSSSAYAVPPATGGYGNTVATGYSQPATTGYGDNRAPVSTGYMDTRQQPPAPASSYVVPQTGYSTVQSGGYGDNYAVRAPTNAYDTAYPPLPQQRGFAGGNDPGPHRDLPPARRY